MTERCRMTFLPTGPEYVWPIAGGIVEMVKDPYGFWERQRLYSFPGMSWHRYDR